MHQWTSRLQILKQTKNDTAKKGRKNRQTKVNKTQHRKLMTG